MQDFKIQRPDPDGRAKPQSKPQSQPQQPDSTDHTAYYKPRHRQAQQNQSTYTRSSDNGPMLVYVLYLISLLVVVTAPAGLVYAYQSRAGANDLDRSHYTFQIRMFWIGLLLLGVGVIGIPFMFGWFVLVGWAVWLLYAITTGMRRWRKGQPAS